MRTIVSILLVAISTSLATAQLNLPAASPDSEFKQQVGFAEVSIKYSRPSARGRVVFGGLVPYGELWRTGAHDATTIQLSEGVKLAGNDIPAGTYSLFTIPNPSEWTIVINKTAEMHGTSEYSESQDLVRFVIHAEKAARYYETFTIEINDFTKEEASMYLIWENTQVRIPIRTNADDKVMAEINDRINIKKEDRPSLYYQSSLYYFNNSKDNLQAYEWIKYANSKTQDAAYLQLQAKIEASLGNFTAAQASLKKSTELAKSKKLEQIVLANEKLMSEWSSKSKTK